MSARAGTKGGKKMNRLWIGTGGDVTCENHAGSYLKASIEADPEATHHITPLDWWIVYATKGMPCETCTPWMSISIPA